MNPALQFQDTLNRRLLFASRVIAVATVVGTAVAVIAAVLKFAC